MSSNQKRLDEGEILPIYSSSKELPQNSLRKLMEKMLNTTLAVIEENIPEEIIKKYKLMGRKEALKEIHFPKNSKNLEEAKRRFAVEELLVLEMGILQKRFEVDNQNIERYHLEDKKTLVKAYLSSLPFELTNAQKRVITEIYKDLANGRVVNRLVQGDVGSGKTAVSMVLLLYMLENSYQGVLMAPTEILAVQHYLSVKDKFEKLGVRVELLTGSFTGKKKQRLLEDIANGDVGIIIGTHALIEESVVFHRLGMIIIDEQHRFGVLQRKALRDKGVLANLVVMSATPIPRSLALSIYGDLDVSIIDDGVVMYQDDLLLYIERHATSKISKKDDLYNLYTYGFRGEALSSISAVSKMSISSRVEESEVGSQITVLGGKVTSLKDVQRNRGTTIEIKELFFNTPARLKFLRKPSTEYINIKDIIIQEALSNPDVAIMLILDGKVSIKTSGNGLDNAIVEIFGKNVLKNMKKFKLGYLGNGAIYRSTKDSIFTFVNNRMVKSKIVESAVIDGYYTKLMKGKYPFAIIFLDINPKDVDVNVHPSKKIVKFADEEEVYNYVLKEIEKTFARDDDFVSPTLQEKIEKEESKFLDFSEFEKFTPMKSEPQQFQELLEEEKDIEEEIFGEKREKLQEKDILREEFEEKKEYEVIEDKRIEKEIVREENIEFNTEHN